MVSWNIDKPDIIMNPWPESFKSWKPIQTSSLAVRVTNIIHVFDLAKPKAKYWQTLEFTWTLQIIAPLHSISWAPGLQFFFFIEVAGDGGVATQSSGVVSFNAELCCGIWAELHAASSSSPFERVQPLQLQRGERWLNHLGPGCRTVSETPTGPRVNIKTGNRSYLHTISQRQRQTDLERERWNKRVEGKKKKKHGVVSRHMAAF